MSGVARIEGDRSDGPSNQAIGLHANQDGTTPFSTGEHASLGSTEPATASVTEPTPAAASSTASILPEVALGQAYETVLSHLRFGYIVAKRSALAMVDHLGRFPTASGRGWTP